MPAFNPTSATVTAPFVVRDSVTAFRLTAKRVDSIAATADVPVPAANADGTYTVSLSSLEANITSDYFGSTLNLYVAAVSASGVSPATVSPEEFVYQPIPAAPTAVSIP